MVHSWIFTCDTNVNIAPALFATLSNGYVLISVYRNTVTACQTVKLCAIIKELVFARYAHGTIKLCPAFVSLFLAGSQTIHNE